MPESETKLAPKMLTVRYIKNRSLEMKHGANTRYALMGIIKSMTDEELEEADIIQIHVEKRD